MKRAFFILLFFFPRIVSGQAQADYEHVMDRFMNFYNHNQGDSISSMFATQPSAFNQGSVESMLKHNGRIRYYKYIGIDPADSVVLIKTMVTKLQEPKVIGIKLSADNKIGTFRFFTSSPYIDSLLNAK